MLLAVAADVLDHVDRVPAGLANHVVDGVGAVLDQGPHRGPAAAIVGAEKRSRLVPVGPSLVLEMLFEAPHIDPIDRQDPPQSCRRWPA